MKKITFYVVMAVLCLFFKVNAQPSGQKITSKITDELERPLAGATVRIKGTKHAQAINYSGNFVLPATVLTGVLLIRFLGYQPREIHFSPANPVPALIKMVRDENALKEVEIVSTGYQQLPKERATGSFATPDKAVFEARVSSGVLSRLEGITSGLVFNARAKGLNQSVPDLNIRGRSTIYSNDQPLIVVDNFPYNGNINDLNPQDVASVTILKDAAAASIWGVKAGNGVIVITTKRGRKDQKTEINVNASLTIGAKPDLFYEPNFLPSAAYIDLQQTLFRMGRYDADLNNTRTFPSIPLAVEIMEAKRKGAISLQDSASRIDALKNIDIRAGLAKHFYQHPISQQYGLNISSGGRQLSHYFSAGYDAQQTNQKSVHHDRITLNYLNTWRPLSALEITTQLNYVTGKSGSGNPLSMANAATVAGLYYPYTAFSDADGNPLRVNRGYGRTYLAKAAENGFLNWDWNPLGEFGSNQTRGKTTDVRIFTGAGYQIWKGLSAEVKYQYQNYRSEQSNLQGLDVYTTRDLINRYSILTAGKVSGYNIPLGDILNLSENRTISDNFRAQLSYQQSGRHGISAVAGTEIIQSVNSGNSNRLYGYDRETENFTVVNPISVFPLNPRGNGIIASGDAISGGTDRFRSFFVSAAYTYHHRYTFSASARQDGSNYFGVAANQKTVPLWSVGGKWAASEEKFYQVPWLPLLGLRASYGYNGNLNKSVTGITTLAYQKGAELTSLPYATISNIGNPDLRWEKNGILNLGIDFATRANILSGSIEYFFKNGVDLIGNQLLAPSVGYLNPATGTYVLSGNFANMKGQGLDVQLNTKNLSGNLSWVSSLNFSYATDKVTRYDQQTTLNYGAFASGGYDVLPKIGKPVYGLYSYKWAGLDGQNGDPQGYIHGKRSKDYKTLTNPGSIDDLVYHGSSRPRYFGGISNRLSYKKLSLQFNISYKLGYYFRSSGISYGNLLGSGGGHKEYDQRWQKPGDELHSVVPSMIYPADNNRDLFYQNSEVMVERADHIRLQDVFLGYDLIAPGNRISRTFKKFQVYAYANQLGILWKANRKGLDPDFHAGGIPTARAIALGLKAQF
jgi:TonB-linked SusC/RagA family outer membrane protein